MAKTRSGRLISSTTVKATRRPIGKGIGPVADDCGCVNDQGCCKDKGCCREGKCPAESLWVEMGCPGDDFALKLQDREDLVRDYILENKASVVRYFRAKGVEIRQ